MYVRKISTESPLWKVAELVSPLRDATSPHSEVETIDIQCSFNTGYKILVLNHFGWFEGLREVTSSDIFVESRWPVEGEEISEKEETLLAEFF